MKRVTALLVSTVALLSLGAWWLSATWHISYGHALYCAIGTASTVGCDTSPPGPAGRLAVTAVILAAVPALAAVFAWVTGKHASRHAAAKVREHLDAARRALTEDADQRHVIMQQHVERLIKGHCDDIKGHVSAVAGSQASAAATRRKPPAPKGM